VRGIPLRPQLPRLSSIAPPNCRCFGSAAEHANKQDQNTRGGHKEQLSFWGTFFFAVFEIISVRIVALHVGRRRCSNLGAATTHVTSGNNATIVSIISLLVESILGFFLFGKSSPCLAVGALRETKCSEHCRTKE
jgi:hypothetical protein